MHYSALKAVMTVGDLFQVPELLPLALEPLHRQYGILEISHFSKGFEIDFATGPLLQEHQCGVRVGLGILLFLLVVRARKLGLHQIVL